MSAEHPVLTAFRSLFPEAQSPSTAVPVAGHFVFVLDIDNPKPVHLAQFSEAQGNFESDGGWFETHEVDLWAYVPNAQQEMQRRGTEPIDDSHQCNRSS